MNKKFLYSPLSIKSIGENGVFSGYASVFIPILNNNETNEKECFPPINGGLSEFIVYSICLPNNEVWYQHYCLAL